MVVVGGQLKNIARANTVALIPEGFGKQASPAPIAGVVELPVCVWWSAGNGFDLSDAARRATMYAAILAEGRTEDVVAWINPRSLVSTWDQMTVTWAVAQVWQPWIDAFCDRRDQSPIEELEIRRGNFDS